MNTANTLELVEGKTLLDVCGYAYTDKNWGSVIKRQIEKHGFVEGVDFGKVELNSHTDVGNQKSGRKPVEYRFTLNAANHVLLAAMTKLGKAARQQAIDLAVAVQSVPVIGSKNVEAYIGMAKHRAGLQG